MESKARGAGPIVNKKVLIVDDEPEQIEYASAIVVEAGYVPISAMNGIEGMRLAKTQMPDLILLDILMPKMGGVGMYVELKHDEQTKNIPVVIVTGVARGGHFDDRMLGQDQNLPPPDGCIDKPMNPDIVHKLLSDLLS